MQYIFIIINIHKCLPVTTDPLTLLLATDDDPLQAAAALARWVGDQEDELRTLDEAFTQVRENLPKDLDEI